MYIYLKTLIYQIISSVGGVSWYKACKENRFFPFFDGETQQKKHVYNDIVTTTRFTDIYEYILYTLRRQYAATANGANR